MQDSMVILIVIAVIFIMTIGGILLARAAYKVYDKKEKYETCPRGFQLSLNGNACVLPGENLPHCNPCNPGQLFVDDACRYPLSPYYVPPSGWTINHTRTGIKF